MAIFVFEKSSHRSFIIEIHKDHYEVPKYFHTFYILDYFIGVIPLQFYVILLHLYVLNYKKNKNYLFDVFVPS